MPLVSGTIPNLVNGISQQAASLRLRTQGEVQINAYPSLVEGLKKRPPSTYVAKLSSTAASGAYVHTIDRDSTERYVVVATNGDIKVYDLAGNSKTVNWMDRTRTSLNAVTATGAGTAYRVYIPSTVSTITLTTTGITTATVVWEKSSTGAFGGEETTVRTDTTDTSAAVAWTSGDYIRARVSAYTAGTITATIVNKSSDYLATSAPQTDLTAITVADYTFFVNKNVTTAMSGTTTTAREKEALVHVKLGQPDTTYEVWVDGVKEATYTTTSTASSYSTANIATNLYNSLVTNLDATFDKTRIDNVVHIQKNNGAGFTFRVTDTYGDQALIGIKDTVQDFTDLPVRAPNGFVTKVVGDDINAFDDYYVKYDTNSGGQTGVWVETVAGGLDNSFDQWTLPHSLVRETDGTFTFEPITWTDRVVGDADSAPQPSFIGRVINDVFFFRNRLGFLSDENIIMSKVSDFFNLWPETVTTQLDGDRIDVASSHNEVAILKWAVPYSEQLLLFSDRTQFVLDVPDLLTPRSAALKQTTEFEINIKAKPVGSGRNVYFTTNVGSYSRVREYFITSDVQAKDASDVTAHVPRYIPSDCHKIASAPSEDVLFFLSSTEANKLYVYKYFWGGDDGTTKLQSSWGHWLFNAADEILNVDQIDEKLYLVVNRSDGVYLEYINLQPGLEDTGMGFLVHLDRKVTLTGSYDSGTNKTTWTLPWSDSDTDYSVVLGSSWGAQLGDTLNVSRPTATTITATGDYSANSAIIGKQYEFRYDFSEQVVREQSSGGEVAVQGGTLIMKTFTVTYNETGFFEAWVTPQFRSTYKKPFSGVILGQAVVGSINIVNGNFRFSVGTRSDLATVSLRNPTHLPCKFLSAEWEGQFFIRSRRR